MRSSARRHQTERALKRSPDLKIGLAKPERASPISKIPKD
jgi:hypothetical protein